jgi:quinoprotein glucose dehydrogenase
LKRIFIFFPSCIDNNIDGKEVDFVAQITKSSYVFLLDRETGKPLIPIEEVPVPPSTLEGEETWPTQPIPLRPPPFSRHRAWGSSGNYR